MAYTIEEAQAVEDRKRIRRFVLWFMTRRCWMDVEGIIQDIWLEHQDKKVPITNAFMKSRCIDALRKWNRQHKGVFSLDAPIGKEQEREFKNLVSLEKDATEAERLIVDAKDVLNRLFQLARLTVRERKGLWLRFYKGRSIGSIAKELGLSRNLVSSEIKASIDRLRGIATRVLEKGIDE